MKAKILALLKGKALKDLDNNLLYLKGVVLGSKEETINQSNDYELTELEEMEVYTSKEEIEIERLNLVISRMQEQIDKITKPEPREVAHTHLTKEEVREVELMFEKNINIPHKLIASTFNISQPVISRIRRGTHGKTSSEYKTFLMKQK